jgi:hypothetical protein
LSGEWRLSGAARFDDVDWRRVENYPGQFTETLQLWRTGVNVPRSSRSSIAVHQ